VRSKGVRFTRVFFILYEPSKNSFIACPANLEILRRGRATCPTNRRGICRKAMIYIAYWNWNPGLKAMQLAVRKADKGRGG